MSTCIHSALNSLKLLGEERYIMITSTYFDHNHCIRSAVLATITLGARLMCALEVHQIFMCL